MRHRRQEGVTSVAQEVAARNQYHSLQRRQKRECWYGFLESANGEAVWEVLRCTTSRSATSMGAISNERGERAEEDQDKRRMMAEVSFPAPNPYDGPITPPGRPGKAYKLVTDTTVRTALFQQSNQKAPGRDSLGMPILKALFEWDSDRVTALVRQCLRLGYHPRDWKIAKGICIPKPGKKAYDQAKSFRVISLLSCLGKLVGKVVATLIADTVEENGALHLG
jgi:hypothetical protein